MTRPLSMTARAIRARKRRAEIRAHVLANMKQEIALKDLQDPKRKAERRAERLAAQATPPEHAIEAMQQLVKLVHAMQITLVDTRRRLQAAEDHLHAGLPLEWREQILERLDALDRRTNDIVLTGRAIEPPKVDVAAAVGKAIAAFVTARE